MMTNTIIIDSRLTTNVNYSATKNGTPMATFAVANNRKHSTNFFNVVCYSFLADYAHNYLSKAQKCGITGVMEHNIKPNGKQYYNIVARNLDPNRDDGSKFQSNNNHSNKNLADEVNRDLAPMNKTLDRAR